MQEFAAFYGSAEWKRCRAGYRKKVGGLCEMCMTSGLYTPGDIVHHIKPITAETVNNPAIALNWDNLMLLCFKHHEEIHSHKDRRYDILPDGTIIAK